jgi:uncharacterized protein YjbI with pentapeptide repeats
MTFKKFLEFDKIDGKSELYFIGNNTTFENETIENETITTVFENITFKHMRFINCDFKKASFDNCIIKDCKFQDCEYPNNTWSDIFDDKCKVTHNIVDNSNTKSDTSIGI